jgi:2-dehydropantoate 2-reductase
MRICVFGAGAIGGHLAGRLARGGAEVSVVARGAYLDAIRAAGAVAVHAPDATFRAEVRATDDPRTLGPQDAVVVTVKAPALPSVAAGVAPLLREDTPVAFVMNGIPWWYFDGEGGPRAGERRLPRLDPGDAVRNAVGIRRTLGGVVWSACTVAEPGHIRVETADSRVVLGEVDGRDSPRAGLLAAALRAGGMGGEATADIRAALWTKLVNNLTNGPICLLTRRSMRDTFADPALLEAARRAMREGLAIAAAMGRPVPGDPEGRILRSVTLPHKPSVLQDLEAGKALEFDALFTAPLQLARAAGVATPTLDTLVALARQATGFGSSA